MSSSENDEHYPKLIQKVVPGQENKTFLKSSITSTTITEASTNPGTTRSLLPHKNNKFSNHYLQNKSNALDDCNTSQGSSHQEKDVWHHSNTTTNNSSMPHNRMVGNNKNKTEQSRDDLVKAQRIKLWRRLYYERPADVKNEFAMSAWLMAVMEVSEQPHCSTTCNNKDTYDNGNHYTKTNIYDTIQHPKDSVSTLPSFCTSHCNSSEYNEEKASGLNTTVSKTTTGTTSSSTLSSSKDSKASSTSTTTPTNTSNNSYTSSDDSASSSSSISTTGTNPNRYDGYSKTNTDDDQVENNSNTIKTASLSMMANSVLSSLELGILCDDAYSLYTTRFIIPKHRRCNNNQNNDNDNDDDNDDDNNNNRSPKKPRRNDNYDTTTKTSRKENKKRKKYHHTY